jgi:hypothetical protein
LDTNSPDNIALRNDIIENAAKLETNYL